MNTRDHSHSPFLGLMQEELGKAEEQWPPLHSLHEGYAVLLEEVDELWDHVRQKEHKRNPQAIYTELVQIAAVAWRIALNLYEPEQGAGMNCAPDHLRHARMLACLADALLTPERNVLMRHGLGLYRMTMVGQAHPTRQVWTLGTDHCVLCVTTADEVWMYTPGAWEETLQQWAKEVVPQTSPLPAGEGSDHVQLTLDIAGVVLAEAAEEEMNHIAENAPMTQLEALGCAVLRAAERQRAAYCIGNREVMGQVQG